MKLYYFDKPEEITDYRDAGLWVNKQPLRTLTVNLSRYGYRIITIWALSEMNLKDVSVDISLPMTVMGNVMPRTSCMAIATEGVDSEGTYFSKKIKVAAGELYPILIGLDFLNADIDTYISKVKIGSASFDLNIVVDDTPVFEEAICGSKAQGRIKWLNSVAPGGFNVAKGYEPIAMNDNGFVFTGKTASITNAGLIENVESYYTPSNQLTDKVQKKLFYKPMEFIVEGQKFRYSAPRMETLENAAAVVAEGKSDAFSIQTSTLINYEGRFDYTIKLHANKDVILPQMALKAYFAACKYDVGMGLEGGLFRPVKWRFNTKWNQDSLFIGDENCGARIRLKAENYKMPYGGVTYAARPLECPGNTWYNFGMGYVEAKKTEEGVEFIATTDKMIIPAGKDFAFRFEISLTPFHPIRLARTLNIRPYQPEFQSTGLLQNASKRMCNYVTLLAGGDFMPYAGDPFDATGELKYIISEAHKRDIGVNIQYTPNLISSHAADTKILNMFGDDVFFKTATGRLLVAKPKFLGVAHEKEKNDVVIATAQSGRMDNYYVEGVKYITENFGADGVYLDTLNISRDTAERTRRVLDEKSGIPAIMDAGITNQYNPECRFANTLNNGTDILPFVDKLFVKEGYDLKRGRDYIMMELSGIPYGTTAEVASIDNPLMALVFGMTVRYTSVEVDDKKEKACYALHRYLDDFGIAKSKMYGYWDGNNPVSSDKSDVSVTTFINESRMISVVYNFGDKKETFDVGINPKKGFTSDKKKIFCPTIAGIQSHKNLNINSMVTLDPHTGIIIEVK